MSQRKVINKATTDITTALRDAVSRHASSADDDPMSRTAEKVIRGLPLVFSGIAGRVTSSGWESTRQLLSIVCTGLAERRIDLRDSGDIDALFFLLDTYFQGQMQVRAIEHYVDTGEILPIMDMLRNDYDQRRTVFWHTRIKLERLYDFDMSKAAELREQGDDEESWTQLPLEIRAALSGFYEDDQEE